MTGISDVPLIRNAEVHMYNWLFRKGIKIYEYHKNILHAKISVYDGKWVTVGSYNVNNISMYASIELNLEIDEKEFAEKTQEMLDKIIEEDCTPVTSELYGRRVTPFRRLMNRISYDIIRILLFIFTFYYRQNPGMKS
jgi:cardiolipin synthase